MWTNINFIPKYTKDEKKRKKRCNQVEWKKIVENTVATTAAATKSHKLSFSI